MLEGFLIAATPSDSGAQWHHIAEPVENLYFTYRVRVWTSGALQRQKDGVELDYKVFSSQYNVWNQAAEEFSENQDRNQDTPADSEDQVDKACLFL